MHAPAPRPAAGWGRCRSRAGSRHDGPRALAQHQSTTAGAGVPVITAVVMRVAPCCGVTRRPRLSSNPPTHRARHPIRTAPAAPAGRLQFVPECVGGRASGCAAPRAALQDCGRRPLVMVPVSVCLLHLSLHLGGGRRPPPPPIETSSRARAKPKSQRCDQ